MVGIKEGHNTSAKTVKVCVKSCVKRDEVGDVQRCGPCEGDHPAEPDKTEC